MVGFYRLKYFSSSLMLAFDANAMDSHRKLKNKSRRKSKHRHPPQRENNWNENLKHFDFVLRLPKKETTCSRQQNEMKKIKSEETRLNAKSIRAAEDERES